jgi:ABC-type lipoprotein export system ATPase subunit
MSDESLNDTNVLIAAVVVVREYHDGHVRAVAGVDLQIDRGEYVAIMGPSGSGKSTLLNLMGGLDRPDAGEIRFEGRSLADFPSLDDYRSRKIGFVFQSFYLLPTLTAVQNVQVPMFEGTLSAHERRARAIELLELVGLGHRLNHRPSEMSVGERQRAAIARALANRPQLLLADEPTGSLDSKTGAEILGLFDLLHREHGMTLIIVTHSAAVAHAAQRIVWYRDGQISHTPDPDFVAAALATGVHSD